MARMIKVTLPLENMPAFSWETFALVEGKRKQKKGNNDSSEWTNHRKRPLHLTIEKWYHYNGRSQNKRKLNNLHIFEDIGDIGNEYIFKQPFCDQPILSSNKENSEVKVLVDTPEIAK